MAPMEVICLASASPRRREMLESLGLPFESIDPAVDEGLRDELPPMERVVVLAEDKARAAAGRLAGDAPRLVLGADTLVCLMTKGQAERVMGKPEDRAEARRMIESLAGRDHYVHTGIALIDRNTGKARTLRSDSRVSFAPMSPEEIERYLDSGEWRGAAGAYRIQGNAAWFISRIEGSWSGIVGLPLRELYVILNEAKYRFRPLVAEK